jgi:hypothetical protein
MTQLAFFGLGFDLSQAEELAESLPFILFKSKESSSFYRDCFSPSGIELQIFLSRETRGS